jgi:hypothetical protein
MPRIFVLGWERHFTVEAEIARLRAAAGPLGANAIRLIAAALLGQHGTLSGDEIVNAADA